MAVRNDKGEFDVLRIDASARYDSSISRELVGEFLENLDALDRTGGVIERDLAQPLPLLNEPWIEANFTDESERTPEQREVLALSDDLVAELEASDLIVMGVPIYNFGIPAALKAWIDLVARARKTFRYTENGPEGLLTDKKVVLVVASGGTKVGSDVDFATGYLRHVLSFLGMEDVEVVAADGHINAPERIDAARRRLEQIAQELGATTMLAA
jgi:FMN-dependent NADH-azoreductase